MLLNKKVDLLMKGSVIKLKDLYTGTVSLFCRRDGKNVMKTPEGKTVEVTDLYLRNLLCEQVRRDVSVPEANKKVLIAEIFQALK